MNLNPGADPEDMVAVRMWVRDTQVITLRKRPILTLQAIRQAVDEGDTISSAEDLIDRIARGLVARIEQVALEIEETVDDLEEAQLKGAKVTSAQLLAERRALIKLRRFLGPQRDALAELAVVQSKTDLATSFAETSVRMIRNLEALDALKDRLIALGDHLMAEEAARQGRTSYVLGLMAALFLPLGFLTGLFGVNVAGMPWTDWPYGFALVTGSSVAIGAALWVLFKRWGWL